MDFTSAYADLKNSPQFRVWKDAHPQAYLAHFLAQLDNDLQPAPWNIGFYDPQPDRITTFVMRDPITIVPDEEVFKKESSISELHLSGVALTSAAALEKAKAVQRQHYPHHLPMKGLLVLQNLAQPTWNVTFITSTFAALNIKISAAAGELLDHTITTFTDLRAK